MYIDLLEKISDAFDRIPNCIKEKFPGYDNKTYAKVKLLKSRLKSVLELKPYDNLSNKISESLHIQNTSNNTSNGRESPSLLGNNDDDLDDFDLESSQYNKKFDKPIHNDLETSTPDFNYNKNGLSKTVYSDLLAKKSLSFATLSPLNNSNNSVQSDSDTEGNRSKGKFVFKKPSRLTEENKTPVRDVSKTLERFRSASELLKPVLPKEPTKIAPVATSSIDFQPPQLSKNSLLNFNKPCTIVSPIIKDPDEETDDYTVPIDMDDETDILHNSGSVINISDSIPSTSNVASINNKEIPLDEEGWPEYRIEDFEDDLEALTCKDGEPEVVNLMEQSVVNENRPKYEGMGDFPASTKNDGITG